MRTISGQPNIEKNDSPSNGWRRADRSDLSMPQTAWPTIVLFFACMSVSLISWVLTHYQIVPLMVGILFATIAAFAIFTPLHDGAHRTVSRQRWLNELIGRISALFLFVPLPLFRFVHLEHHQYTNNREKDPDLWSGLSPGWSLPVRWLTQDLHYLAFYIARIKQRSRLEIWESLLTILLILFIGVVFCWYGYVKEVLLLWFLPARIAIFLLAFSLDYLPHKPHLITAAEDRFRATSVRPIGLLTPILLYQNYHLIHHLYPGVPFYRYARIWRSEQDYLISKGAIVFDLWGKKTTDC